MLRGWRAGEALLIRCRVYLQQSCHNSNKVSNKGRAPTPVVLREDSVSLGPAGKVVTVAPGYARNHLIPTRVAALATPANRTAYERKENEQEVAASQLSRKGEAALQAQREERQLELVMKRLLTAPVVLERELAPDLEPPPAWNEKQRLLTMLVEPVTRTEVCAAIAKQKRVTVVEGMLDMPGNSFAETGDYRIRLRMIDSQGRQPEFVLSILPIKPSVVATADDAVAA